MNPDVEEDCSAFDQPKERACETCAHCELPEPYLDAGDVGWCRLYDDFVKASEDDDCEDWRERDL